MVFGQVLCVLGEVVGLGECEQRANSTSKGLKVGSGTVFVKVQESSGEQRLWQEILVALGEAYYRAWA